MARAEEAIRLDAIDQLSWEIYHLARDMARYTPGVIDVQNALLVDLS